MSNKTSRLGGFKLTLIYLSPIITGLLMLNIGDSDVELFRLFAGIFDFLLGSEIQDTQIATILDIRLPRILLALLVGASLCGCGAVMQNVFKNPLVDPFMLGISSGAALGCALSIGIFPQINLSLLAFLGAIGSFALIMLLGRVQSNTSLILIGVVINSFFGALVALIQFFVPPQESQSITIWLFGSLSLSSWSDVGLVAFGFVVAFVPLMLLRFKINILSLQDSEAYSLGVNVWRVKIICMFCVSFICALCVSVSGVIGWIGLVVPHIARYLVGANMLSLLPSSLALGASFLVLSDGLARGFGGYDLPLSAINAILFAPIFILLTYKYARG